MLAATGAHWGALQAVAWTTMLADNLRNGSFADAVSKTFDGRHPCPLCKQIAAERKADQKKEFSAPAKRLEFPPVRANPVLIAPLRFCLVPQTETFVCSIPQEPPTPPPRGFFA